MMTLSATAASAAVGASCDPTAAVFGECEIAIEVPISPGPAPDDDASGVGFYYDPNPDPNADCVYVVQERCYRRVPKPADDAPAPATPPVTIDDVATFQPSASESFMQPNGWIVVGLDTNFYSNGAPTTVTGSLLGQPAAVRFTPVVWHWDYGDGTTASLGIPGASWEALGVGEFEPTPTSHVFAAPGNYTITLSVEYVADYQFAGGDWLPIDGTLTVPSNELVATAATADTVLVGRDCTEAGAGVGCVN